MAIRKKLLMIEDVRSIAELYRSYLNPLGVEVNLVFCGRDGLAFLEQYSVDLVLLDLRLPDGDGLDFLVEIKQNYPKTKVIIMTAYGSIENTIKAMRQGADDFLIKPCEADQLRIAVNQSINQTKLTYYKNTSNANKFIGSSAEMKKVYRIINAVAPSSATAFITGETGTGKELCAHAIHSASPRSNKQFVAINCAAIPKDLIESELFGHVKGAFTGAIQDRIGAVEQADKGTLFLDELGEMDIALQAKLLRFIQSGEYNKVGSSKKSHVDVRLVCATNIDPWQAVQKGQLREDLYYRVHVIPITMPPLRHRDRDVLEIAYTLLSDISVQENKSFIDFDDEVKEFLLSYHWPGNIRQLQNLIRHCIVLHNDQKITMNMFPKLPNEPVDHQHIDHTVEITQQEQGATITNKLEIEPLWKIEQRAIEQAIKLCNNNIVQAATFLEINPSTLYRKLQQWGKQNSI